MFKRYVLGLCAVVFASTPIAQAAMSPDSYQDNDILLYDSRSVPAVNVAGGSGGCYDLALPNIVDSAKAAEAINAFISTHATKSPMQGMGTDAVAGAAKSNFNPMIIIAMGLHESGLGVAGVATKGINNAFGRTATESQPHIEINGRRWYKYASWQASLNSTDDHPMYMKQKWIDSGTKSIDDLIPKYAPASDGNDVDLYVKTVKGHIDKMIELSNGGITCGATGGSGGGPPGGSLNWVWPADKGKFTIGQCWNNAYNGGRHAGQDFPMPNGTPLYAVANGTVEWVRDTGSAGGGKHVLINVGGGLWVNYQHMQKWEVSPNQRVTQGQRIGFSNNTGNSTGSHLHFGVATSATTGAYADNSQTLNPFKYLPPEPDMANYKECAGA